MLQCGQGATSESIGGLAMESGDPVLRRCFSILSSHYGKRLKGVVLCGPCAQGTETAESTIELLVLLDGPVAVVQEIRRIWDVLYAAQFHSDRVISVLPADVGAYEAGSHAVYKAAREQGVPL